MAKDPVCGMGVEEGKAAARAEFRGQTYYFCSTGCHQTFLREPEKYADVTTATRERSPEAQGGGGRQTAINQ